MLYPAAQFACILSAPPRGPWHLSVMRPQVALRLPVGMEQRMFSKRRRFTPTQSPEERFADEATRLLEARLLPAGALREHVLRRARQEETGSHMSAWLCSRLPE
jgi:hypothetical protein